ncbi:hypothetical protein WR25_26873 [Diploscapter pachys]|uniref:Uncharacterized protein n=1 Tax=Diploscapter pachys TaxID=2018661 RepID=A0A2A2M5Q7_9BILA|nr:hypothetical protein WR25_26873 [Diploscapter pachys]
MRRDTDVSALLDWHARSPGLTPSALVFHASRCGSTLIAQLLASQARNIVLSEPPPLDNLLRAARQDPSAAAWQADALRALCSAYARCLEHLRRIIADGAVSRRASGVSLS